MDLKNGIKTGMDNFADKCREMAGEAPQEAEKEEKQVNNLFEDKLKRIEAIIKE